jgi:hypothetical protein
MPIINTAPIWKRQWAEQNGAHEAEDGSVGTDAKREHRDRRKRKPGGFAERSHRVPNILNQLVQPDPAAHSSHLLFHPLPPRRRAAYPTKH